MNKQTIYALGFFDGVHLGHQALLSACRQLADAHGFAAGAVTFLSHPETTIPGKTPGLVNTAADRKRLLHDYQIQTVVELPFDNALRSMNWRDFIRMLRGAPYHAAGFVCGADFRFGHKGEGTAAILQEYCRAAGMPCAIVPEQQLNGIRISSTHIRSLLEQGDVAQAAVFLGHPHTLSGTVVAGRGLGRTIGIPTANLLLPPELIRPKLGVYACTAVADGKVYPAVTNIGCRPTVGGHHITVEPWLLDFAGDLYGKEIILNFHKFLRPETKFDSLEALRCQIQRDAAETYHTLQEV